MSKAKGFYIEYSEVDEEIQLHLSFPDNTKTDKLYDKMFNWGLPVEIKQNRIIVREARTINVPGVFKYCVGGDLHKSIGIRFSSQEQAEEFNQISQEGEITSPIKIPLMTCKHSAIYFDAKELMHTQYSLNKRALQMQDYTKSILMLCVFFKYIPPDLSKLIITIFKRESSLQRSSIDDINRLSHLNQWFKLGTQSITLPKYARKMNCYLEYSPVQYPVGTDIFCLDFICQNNMEAKILYNLMKQLYVSSQFNVNRVTILPGRQNYRLPGILSSLDSTIINFIFNCESDKHKILDMVNFISKEGRDIPFEQTDESIQFERNSIPFVEAISERFTISPAFSFFPADNSSRKSFSMINSQGIKTNYELIYDTSNCQVFLKIPLKDFNRALLVWQELSEEWETYIHHNGDNVIIMPSDNSLGVYIVKQNQIAIQFGNQGSRDQLCDLLNLNCFDSVKTEGAMFFEPSVFPQFNLLILSAEQIFRDYGKSIVLSARDCKRAREISYFMDANWSMGIKMVVLDALLSRDGSGIFSDKGKVLVDKLTRNFSNDEKISISLEAEQYAKKNNFDLRIFQKNLIKDLTGFTLPEINDEEHLLSLCKRSPSGCAQQ